MASLKSFTKPEEKGRLGFSMPLSGLREFVQYVVYIQTREGFEVERGDVLAEVIKAWTASDKDYVRWVDQELNARAHNGEDPAAKALQARVNKLLKADKDAPPA